MSPVTQLLQALIRFHSVTPEDNGSMDFLVSTLSALGFECHVVEFKEPGHADVKNLYARLGKKGINLCFAGHMDVVPCGNESNWSFPPFEGRIYEAVIYGRGAVDMKGAIAAFIEAVRRFLNDRTDFNHSISLLITGDEEGIAVNGTKKMLTWLKDRGEKIDFCIIGEPTSKDKVGDTIKVGARGSITINIELFGKQGHVAYHEIADNPVPKLADLITTLKAVDFDDGNQHFQPSNLEFTNIYIDGGTAENLIPASASMQLNIRFGNMHTAESLSKLIYDLCNQHYHNHFKMSWHSSGNAFVTKHDQILPSVLDAIKEEVGIEPVVNTLGGTSDARFMVDHFQVLEIGLLNGTAHKVNEHVSIADLNCLTDIYYKIMEGVYSKNVQHEIS